jgi:signal transduction histidine kinase
MRRDAGTSPVAMVSRVRSWANVTAGGLPVPEVAVAVFLSLYAATLTSGLVQTGHRTGGVGASIGVLAMTVPVAWCRRAPVGAAAVVAAGAVLNAIVFGSMVRCGPALPAVFILGFFVAARSDRVHAALGLGLCAVNVATQTVSDPQLGASVMGLMLPVLGLFFVLGLVLRARTEAVESLKRRTADLRRHREQTARMSVMADRARLSEDLGSVLRDRIGRIASTAAVGRESVDSNPTAVLEALASIECDGREVLRQMREIVGSLDQVAPSAPQPSLAELQGLLTRATAADTRLTVEGSPRRLPVGMELAGYRIAEHLLTALRDTTDATIDVRLRFAADAFELNVSGPPASDVELAPVLAAARERAALHGGTLDGRTAGGVCQATARLPLVTSHA